MKNQPRIKDKLVMPLNLQDKRTLQNKLQEKLKIIDYEAINDRANERFFRLESWGNNQFFQKMCLHSYLQCINDITRLRIMVQVRSDLINIGDVFTSEEKNQIVRFIDFPQGVEMYLTVVEFYNENVDSLDNLDTIFGEVIAKITELHKAEDQREVELHTNRINVGRLCHFLPNDGVGA